MMLRALPLNESQGLRSAAWKYGGMEMSWNELNPVRLSE